MRIQIFNLIVNDIFLCQHEYDSIDIKNCTNNQECCGLKPHPHML